MPCRLGGQELGACHIIAVDFNDNVDNFQDFLGNDAGDYVSFMKMLVNMGFCDGRGGKNCGAERQNHRLLHIQG